MVDQTPRRELNTYATGDANWTHTDVVEDHDELAIERGPIADRSASGDYDDELFYATDQKTLWGWDESESDWTARGGVGVDGAPLPEQHVAILESERTAAASQGTDGIYYDDGRIVGERYATWGQQADYYARVPDRSVAVVAFSFDDAAVADYDDVFPEFRDRGMPWGENLIAGYLGDGGRLGADQVDEMVAHGAEVVCHGAQSENLQENADDEQLLREEIVEAKRALEANDWKVQGYLPYGQSGIDSVGGSSSSANYDEYFSHLLRSAFTWSIGDGGETHCATNFTRLHGDGNKNYDLDDADSSSAIEMIDHLIAVGGAMEFSGHPGDWGASERSALRTVLDHCATERDESNLVVTTPTTLRCHDRDPQVVNFVPNGDANAYDDFDNDLSWTAFGNAPRVATSGGAVGSNHWRIGAALGADSWGGLRLYDAPYDAQFPAIMVQLQAKGPDGDESLTVEMANHQLTGDDRGRSVDLTSSWSTHHVPFGFSRSGDLVHLRIWTGSDEVHVDDVRIYPC